MFTRGVMIPALDLNPESDFQLFGDSGFGSNKKRNHKAYRGVIIPAMDSVPKLDFRFFDYSGTRFRSSKQ